MIVDRPQKLCNFLEWKDGKIVYKRFVEIFVVLIHLYPCRCSYASLYFVMMIDKDDNELMALETVHHFVEILDRYFGNVSLDWS